MAQNLVEPIPQMDSMAAPRAILDDAKRRAVRGKKIENLELLWSVLIEIRSYGGRDYSLAEIGRRLEEKGGLKTQSLRNAGGSDFREVITAFAMSVFGSPRFIAKTKSNVDQALDFISDPSIRAVLKEAIAKAKNLRAENAALRNVISRLSIPELNEPTMLPVAPVPPNMSVANISGNNMIDTAEPVSLLSEQLAKAIRIGVDRRRIMTLGFEVLEDGSIINGRKDQLFPKGFVTACEAILIDLAKVIK